MHHTPGMSNQWKWPINNDEIWYEKVAQKIAPPELADVLVSLDRLNLMRILIFLDIFWKHCSVNIFSNFNIPHKKINRYYSMFN